MWRKILAERREEHLDFLKTLLAKDTTNRLHGVYGKEEIGQGVIIEKLTEMGLEIDVFEPDNEKLMKYKEAGRGHHYDDRPNVVGVLKGTGGGRSLILNGHIDTMPFDQLEKWESHPLEPIVRDGKLYGRGSCDMKAGLASIILAVEALIDSGVKLKGDVIIQSVVDEEGGGNGTLACVDRGYVADAAIITEPTSLEIMHAHMGWLYYRMEIVGKSLHSALKWDGVNAIEKMMKIIHALQDFEREYAIRKRHPFLPPPTFNFGAIKGGMAGTIVPDYCMLDFGLHFLPEDGDEDGLGTLVEEEVFQVIEGVVQGDPWLREYRPVIKKYQQGSGYQIPADHPIVQVMAKNARNHLGRDVTVRGAEYGTDARLLNNYGKIPTIIFGPGSINQAHSINEYVPVEEYFQSIAVLADVIWEWCG